MTQRYIVSCNHKVERYRLNNETISVRQDGFDQRWYWSHPTYGCSKSYSTPENAICGMLQDHACFNIRIAPLS